MTDRSGTITTGTSVTPSATNTVMAGNGNRHYFSIQNPSTNGESIYRSIGGGPWFEIVPGAIETQSGGDVPKGVILLKSVSTGTAFTAEEE